MIKSIFVVVYLMSAFSVTISGILALLGGGSVPVNGGLILIAGPVAFILGRLMVFKDKARTSGALVVPIILAAIGLALVLSSWISGEASSRSMIMAFVMAVMLLLYIFWYSRLDRSASKLTVGKALPTFNLEANDGSVVPSDGFKGTITILVFYRGNWCPLCVAQVKEMAAQYNKLKELGARVIFVSPQPQNYTMSLAEKFGTDGLEFMRDADNAAAGALGLDVKYGVPMGMQAKGYDSHTVLPTVIILDAEGKVVWTHETDNYRVRPEPETYLSVIEEMGLQAR